MQKVVVWAKFFEGDIQLISLSFSPEMSVFVSPSPCLKVVIGIAFVTISGSAIWVEKNQLPNVVFPPVFLLHLPYVEFKKTKTIFFSLFIKIWGFLNIKCTPTFSTFQLLWPLLTNTIFISFPPCWMKSSRRPTMI